MKKLTSFLLTLGICVGLRFDAFCQLQGAWKQTLPEGITAVMICSDGYLMISRYKEKEFVMTEGGTYRIENNVLNYHSEFNSSDTSKVGRDLTLKTKGNPTKRSIEQWGDWQRLDEGKTPAAAVYRITGRMGNDNQITPMQRGARKTLKMLTDTRFQWVAINPETKQFSGTGGGTYTIKDGKYTETIDFFSRDNNRVGASLSFDYELKDGKDWHHSGLSSAGAKIYEVWSKEK